MTQFERKKQADIERWLDQDDRVAMDLRDMLRGAIWFIEQMPTTVAEPSPDYPREEMLSVLRGMLPEEDSQIRRGRLLKEILNIKG